MVKELSNSLWSVVYFVCLQIDFLLLFNEFIYLFTYLLTYLLITYLLTYIFTYLFIDLQLFIYNLFTFN